MRSDERDYCRTSLITAPDVLICLGECKMKPKGYRSRLYTVMSMSAAVLLGERCVTSKKRLLWRLHDHRIYFLNIDRCTSSVWNFCRWVADVPPRETSPATKSEEKPMFSQATYVWSQNSCCKEFGLLFNFQQNQSFWYLWWWKFSYLISNRMWSHTELEFDLKLQVHVWFQTQIARHEIQLPFYYSHFEIAEFSQYQYFIDQLAGLSKSGNKKAFTSHFVFETEMMRYGAKMTRCRTWLTQEPINAIWNRCDLEQKWCDSWINHTAESQSDCRDHQWPLRKIP